METFNIRELLAICFGLGAS